MLRQSSPTNSHLSGCSSFFEQSGGAGFTAYAGWLVGGAAFGNAEMRGGTLGDEVLILSEVTAFGGFAQGVGAVFQPLVFMSMAAHRVAGVPCNACGVARRSGERWSPGRFALCRRFSLCGFVSRWICYECGEVGRGQVVDVANHAVAIVIEKGGSGAALASAAVEMINAYFTADEIGTAILPENQLLQ